MLFILLYGWLAVSETDYLGIRGLITAITPISVAIIGYLQYRNSKKIDRTEEVSQKALHAADRVKDHQERNNGK